MLRVREQSVEPLPPLVAAAAGPDPDLLEGLRDPVAEASRPGVDVGLGFAGLDRAALTPDREVPRSQAAESEAAQGACPVGHTALSRRSSIVTP